MVEPSTHSLRTHLLSLTPDELTTSLSEMGGRPFCARQIAEWVYGRGACSFEEMTNLSKRLRADLGDALAIYTSRVDRREESNDGTVKLLLRWPDHRTSECVLIPGERHWTACISSQVGCPVGCMFCASGLDGLARNLTAGEMVEQALRIRAEAGAAGGRLSRIVFMGLGEPLANYRAVMKAVGALNAAWGLNIGARKITISTVGLPDQIRKLAEEGWQLNLALSLHAPTTELRRELIPWSTRISIPALQAACRYYFERTGREVTVEYILLRGTNDSSQHAEALARFAKGLRCHVNLLRYNPVETLPYERPTSLEAHRFQAILRRLGVNSHLRRSRGLDIDAACGQLRRKTMARNRAAVVSIPVEPTSSMVGS